MYSQFTAEQIDREAESFADASYIEELRAEHYDPDWDCPVDPEEAAQAAQAWEAEQAAEADRDGRYDWADVDY